MQPSVNLDAKAPELNNFPIMILLFSRNLDSRLRGNDKGI